MNERRRTVAHRRNWIGAGATPLLPRRFPATPLAAAIVAALYPATAALAQRSDTALEEVVVTATRRELDLQSVPQSITALSTGDISKQALRSTADVIGALPSVNLVNSMPGRNSIVMRGVSTGSAEYRTDSQVAVYLDDQPMSSISQQVEVRLIDLERIESLPGPQGTLFGSSSQSGTIRYITNKPDTSGFSAQLDGGVDTTRGGEEGYDISGHLNMPMSDNIAVRAVGFYSVEGGYVDNVLGTTLMGDQDNADLVEEDWNDYTIYGGRIAARWQVSPEWETTLSLVSQFSEADGVWESDEELGDYKITRFFDEWRDDDWYQVSMSVKGDLGFAELSATASYFDRDIKYEWDNANYSQWRSAYYGGFDPVSGVGSFNVYNTGFEIGPQFNWQVQDRWAYEVRLTSQGESRFQWMAGAFYEDVYDWWHYGATLPGLMNTTTWEVANYYACQAYDQGYDISCPLADTDIYYSNIFDKTIKQTAVFGEVTYDLTERWSVTGGARWFEYDRVEYDTYNVPFGLPVSNDFEEGGRHDREGKESDTIYKAGTQFKFDDDRMVYLLYSEGYRLGGNNSARAAATGVIPETYGPDKLKNYEAGLKSQWLDDALQLNVSLFFMEWDDIQINSSGSDATNGQPDDNTAWWMRGTFNGGKAEQKGIEINGTWNITENFSIEASAFVADPEFTEDTFYPGGEVYILAGTVMPISPEEKYYLYAEYSFPNFMGLNGDMWTRVSYTYQSEVWNDLDSVLEYHDPASFADDPEDPDEVAAIRARARDQLIPSWSTTTLQIGFTHDSGWEAALVVRNLFDEQGIEWMSDTDYGSMPEFGADAPWDDSRFRFTRTLQRPRSIGLSFSKKW